MFGKVGTPDNLEALYAAADGKTFIGIFGDPDITNSVTYAPFYARGFVYDVNTGGFREVTS